MIKKLIKNSRLKFVPSIWYIANKMRIIFISYKINFLFWQTFGDASAFLLQSKLKVWKKKEKKTECRFLGFLKSQAEDCYSLKQKNKTKKTNKNKKSRLNEILQTRDDADCSWAQKQTVNDVKSFRKQMFQWWTHIRMFRNVFFPSAFRKQVKSKCFILFFGS